MFGAAPMDWSEVLCVVVLMLAGTWFLARSREAAPPSGSRPSHLPESSAVLETRARKLEKTGDFDGAMEALLVSHSAGSSQAVMLAHDLAQRHPGTFQSKGCPVGPTSKPAAADTTTSSAAGDYRGGGGGGGGGGDGDLSDQFSAPSVGKSAEQRTSERDALPSAVDRTSDVDPSALSPGESTMGPAAATPPPPPPESDGQTPWERGWHGPEGFKPPQSHGVTVSAAATAAGSEAVLPAPENALYSSVNSNNDVVHKRGRFREGGGGAGGGDILGGSSGEALGGNASNAAAKGLRNFTVAQLNAFDGSVAAPVTRGGLVRAGVARPVYIALKGNVYDASAGNDLYGPGGKYTEFAGHDISRRVARGLAGGSSGKDGSAELDDLALDGLDRFEQMTLTGWEDMFAAKGYPVLGRVVVPPPPRKFSRAELRYFDGRPVLEEGRGGQGEEGEEGGGGWEGVGGGGRGEGGGGAGGGGEGGAGREGGGAGGGGRGGAGQGGEGGQEQGGCSFQHVPPGYAVPPIYLGVKDKVFDVSFGGSEFYLKGGSYECLAGRDASRVLAKMSMTPEDIEGVLDYENLTDTESKNLADWVEKLGNAGRGYPVVGWIDLNNRE
eukprot:jgi/Undpi1/13385/HiC_scaffold_8.g03044.m1